ncbi:MAG: metallophosphoesterase [Chloroflexota bacterium]
MYFLTISDEVAPVIYSLDIKQRFSDVECVLGCGDLPYYYLEYVVTMLGVPCFYVHGNHDSAEYTAHGEIVRYPRGCDSLEGRSVNYQGVVLAGLGGSIRYNNRPGAQYTERQMLMRAWRLVPRLIVNRWMYGRYLDVLLTHAPPLNIHDGPDRPHRGFKVFLDFMDRFKPRYLIHGHIHRSYGFSNAVETQYNQTTVINTAGHRRLFVESQQQGGVISPSSHETK